MAEILGFHRALPHRSAAEVRERRMVASPNGLRPLELRLGPIAADLPLHGRRVPHPTDTRQLAGRHEADKTALEPVKLALRQPLPSVHCASAARTPLPRLVPEPAWALRGLDKGDLRCQRAIWSSEQTSTRLGTRTIARIVGTSNALGDQASLGSSWAQFGARMPTARNELRSGETRGGSADDCVGLQCMDPMAPKGFSCTFLPPDSIRRTHAGRK